MMSDANSNEVEAPYEIPMRSVAWLVLSIALLFAAVFWTYRVGLEANALAHGLSHLQEDIQETQETIKKLEAEKANPQSIRTEGGAKR